MQFLGRTEHRIYHYTIAFFRTDVTECSTKDAKEINKNVLVVELVLKMETQRSHALGPLRTAIVHGQLGEFEVADFIDICEGSHICILHVSLLFSYDIFIRKGKMEITSPH